jgi:hypothetical protein
VDSFDVQENILGLPILHQEVERFADVNVGGVAD